MDADLEVFRDAWGRAKNGYTGDRFAQALRRSGDDASAVAVWQELWDRGYPLGYERLAWFECERGHLRRAVELMTLVADGYDPNDPDDHGWWAGVRGVIGVWMWAADNDVAAEPFLRDGQAHYEAARTDLAHLLRSTGRAAEGEAVLRAGVAAGEVDGLLPLGNIVAERGDDAEAERLYRAGWDSGDAYSAYNLALLLAEDGRLDEAREWMWRAARGGDEAAVQRLLERGEPPAGSN